MNTEPEGNYHSVLDASSILLLIDHLVQERGLEPARYIRPEYPNYRRTKGLTAVVRLSRTL